MSTLAAATALLLGLAFLAAVFGWRTLAHRRSTGTTGYRGVPGGLGSPGWWGGVLFVLGTLLMIAAPVLALAGLLPPPTGWPPLVVAGVVTALAGIALGMSAQREMGVAWRIGVAPGERTALVTTGVFGYVRNPFFTAMVTVAAGVAFLVPTVVGALAVVCLLLAVEIQVRVVEEPHLTATHGPPYTTYAATVGRFLPRLGRLTAADAARDRPRDARPR